MASDLTLPFPDDAGPACDACKGRGWLPGDCHPHEVCGTCDGTGYPKSCAAGEIRRLDAALAVATRERDEANTTAARMAVAVVNAKAAHAVTERALSEARAAALTEAAQWVETHHGTSVLVDWGHVVRGLRALAASSPGAPSAESAGTTTNPFCACGHDLAHHGPCGPSKSKCWAQTGAGPDVHYCFCRSFRTPDPSPSAALPRGAEGSGSAPSAAPATAAGPTWVQGGGYCDCGKVEFMAPSVACVRVEERGTGPTQHTPNECRGATFEEMRNLEQPRCVCGHDMDEHDGGGPEDPHHPTCEHPGCRCNADGGWRPRVSGSGSGRDRP